ncbi:MAG: class I adenylate-forming enzyme family protein [Tumebacillaceae bacterium]
MTALETFFRETARTDRGVLQVEGDQQTLLTYAELLAGAERLADVLKSHPLRDRFIAAIWMDKTPAYLQAFMAVVLAGGIPVPLHSYSTGGETSAAVRKVEADLLLLSSSKAAQLEKSDISLPALLCCDGETGERLPALSDKPRTPRLYTPPEETAMIILSSGSTGVPKGIMLSSANVLANVRQIQGYVGLQPDDRVLLAKSLGYSSTLTGEWMLALQAGAHLQMTEPFMHPLQMVRFLRDHGTTFMTTSPSAVIPLLKTTRWQADDLAALRQILIVGGGTPPQLLTELQQHLPGKRIIPSYGLTEASPRVTYLPPEQLATRPASVGIPVEDVSVRIIDSNGLPVEAGVEGEVVVQGPNVMLGYYADAERTAAVLTEQGLRTSDIGYLDYESFLYITGRLDNALNVGGHTIYPEPIEQALCVHADVGEAAVVGVPDLVWGERMVAFVVPAQEPFQPQVLHRHCQLMLSPSQRPRDIIPVAELPKTKSGKLDRSGIRAMAKEWNHAEHSR